MHVAESEGFSATRRGSLRSKPTPTYNRSIASVGQPEHPYDKGSGSPGWFPGRGERRSASWVSLDPARRPNPTMERRAALQREK